MSQLGRSIARMAGNIASGLVANPRCNDTVDLRVVAANSVKLARMIVEEIESVQVATEEKEKR